MYIYIGVLIVLWVYSTACLSCIAMNQGRLYIPNVPMVDQLGNYQIHNFIPLCLFTNMFDVKKYIED